MLMEAQPYSSIIIGFVKEENITRIKSISESIWEIVDMVNISLLIVYILMILNINIIHVNDRFIKNC